MNKIRKWKAEKVSRYGGRMTLGNRDDLPELPAGALVSITHGINMNLLQTLVSTLVNHLFILPPLTRNENLLYGEGHGNLMTGESLLITVWRGKGMVEFRDRGAHGWAKKMVDPLRVWTECHCLVSDLRAEGSPYSKRRGSPPSF